MSWFGFLKRSSAAKPTPAGNRTLSQAELAAREAQQEAQAAAAQAKAAKEAAASNPNRLRSSEAFREEQRDKKKKRRERRRDNQIGGLLREVLSGEILAREALVRQVPFLLFASFLTILYLALGYQTERILRESSEPSIASRKPPRRKKPSAPTWSLNCSKAAWPDPLRKWVWNNRPHLPS